MITLFPCSCLILVLLDAVAPVPVSTRLGAVTRAESSLTMAAKKAGKKVSFYTRSTKPGAFVCIAIAFLRAQNDGCEYSPVQASQTSSKNMTTL